MTTRLEMTPETPEDPALAELFAQVRARGVDLPDLYRALGASPDLLRAWIDFAWALRLDAKTPRALRELMILRVSQMTGARYEWAHHRPMALAAGVSEAQLAALSRWRDADRFDAREQAALQATEEIVAGPGASAAAVEALKARFAPDEVIDLLLTASFYVCVSRLLASLDLAVEPAYADAARDFAPDDPAR